MNTLHKTNYAARVSKTLSAGKVLSLAPNNFQMLDTLIHESGDPTIAIDADNAWKDFKKFLSDFNLKVIRFDINYSQGTYLYGLHFLRNDSYCTTVLRMRAFVPICDIHPDSVPRLFAELLILILSALPTAQLVEYANEG